MRISHVLLLLTYRCNLRCEFCLSFNGFWRAQSSMMLPKAAEPKAFMLPGAHGREMSTSDIIGRVIPECEKNGVEVIALSGGEVLLRADALEIFYALGESSMRWCLDSNLMLCDEVVAETLIGEGCGAVFVSFDGRKEIHNKLRRNPKAFDKAVNGLRCLVNARRRMNKSCNITVNFVLQPGNECEPVNMVELALSLGADELNFQLLSERIYSSSFDAEAAASSLRSAHALAWERGLPSKTYPVPNPDANDLNGWYSMPLTDRYFTGCTYIQKNLRIDPAGDVIPCMEYKLGNILEQDLSEIWSGSPYQTLRKKLADSGPFEACLRCCNLISGKVA